MLRIRSSSRKTRTVFIQKVVKLVNCIDKKGREKSKLIRCVHNRFQSCREPKVLALGGRYETLVFIIYLIYVISIRRILNDFHVSNRYSFFASHRAIDRPPDLRNKYRARIKKMFQMIDKKFCILINKVKIAIPEIFVFNCSC